MDREQTPARDIDVPVEHGRQVAVVMTPQVLDERVEAVGLDPVRARWPN